MLKMSFTKVSAFSRMVMTKRDKRLFQDCDDRIRNLYLLGRDEKNPY